MTRERCTACRRIEALDEDRATVPQGEHGGLCWRKWGSPCPPPTDEPSGPFGGETGGENAGSRKPGWDHLDTEHHCIDPWAEVKP